MKSFTADYVFPVHADPIKNGVVTVDDHGKIISVTDKPIAGQPQPQYFSGIISPGFINAHCHLELSHMKGKIATKTGLVDFIKSIMQHRGNDNGLITSLAAEADHNMYENGIVAVGDISNTNT